MKHKKSKFTKQRKCFHSNAHILCIEFAARQTLITGIWAKRSENERKTQFLDFKCDYQTAK